MDVAIKQQKLILIKNLICNIVGYINNAFIEKDLIKIIPYSNNTKTLYYINYLGDIYFDDKVIYENLDNDYNKLISILAGLCFNAYLKTMNIDKFISPLKEIDKTVEVEKNREPIGYNIFYKDSSGKVSKHFAKFNTKLYVALNETLPVKDFKPKDTVYIYGWQTVDRIEFAY